MFELYELYENIDSESNPAKLKKFIMYYEKITRWMMKTSKLNSNILIKIDKYQKFQKIIYK